LKKLTTGIDKFLAGYWSAESVTCGFLLTVCQRVAIVRYELRSQQRVASDVDSPPRPAGNLYCRVPQDSPFNVRGARNIQCETKPGKRAPTAGMCESDENYVPLNDGYNWKGDPNATLSGQPIPQPYPGDPAQHAPAPPAAPPVAPVATATYDPSTGMYVGPDGKVHTQSNLARTSTEQTWQSMLLPPAGK
jgi:phospholipid/cholesterol/gamma-HCH transport system substrate-binding protein